MCHAGVTTRSAKSSRNITATRLEHGSKVLEARRQIGEPENGKRVTHIGQILGQVPGKASYAGAPGRGVWRGTDNFTSYGNCLETPVVGKPWPDNRPNRHKRKTKKLFDVF